MCAFRFSECFSCITVCLLANLDVLSAAAAQYQLFAQNKLTSIFCITLPSVVMTGICTLLGGYLAASISAANAEAASGALFILLALASIGSECRKKGEKPPIRLALLSISLALNNIGTGLAAGIGKLSPILITGFTLLFSVSFAYIGIHFAKKLTARFSAHHVSIAANLVLFLLGTMMLLSGLFFRL